MDGPGSRGPRLTDLDADRVVREVDAAALSRQHLSERLDEGVWEPKLTVPRSRLRAVELGIPCRRWLEGRVSGAHETKTVSGED